MAYIGRQLVRGENKLFDDISSSFNGSTTTFNLTVSSVATSTATALQLFVSLNGVLQKPNTDFTTAGNQITFASAPANGVSCFILMQGDAIDSATVSDGSITPLKLGGQDFAFTGDIRLKDADGSNYVGFQAPTTVASNKVWTLPAADGSANQVLKTNGSGVLSWAADSTVTEGTSVLSTGESTTTKYLRTDGDGTCSWQTIDTSTFMLLAGGIFTGDVTFDGATAGRDIVFDRSDNALEFADNAKAIFGGSSELQLYYDGNNSYIEHTNHGETLILKADYIHLVEHQSGDNQLRCRQGFVELYDNGIKRFETVNGGVAITGTATVSTNLTVTGNLTVSGTTTTINTQTLDVEDKNVVIGKVSTPSDTTADGGGWTLKGATDKTFNWVNATDAWTSSEHINLGDNKTILLGTDSDLQLKHSGSTGVIDNTTGDLFIKTTGSGDDILLDSADDIYLRVAGTQSGVEVIGGGAVKLYHNNVKTFETFGDGITVRGPNNTNGIIQLFSDNGDDNADKWRFMVDTSGNLTFGNYSTGSWVVGCTFNTSNKATFGGAIEVDGRIDGKTGGHLDIRTLSAHSIQLRTNNTLRLNLDSSGHLVPYLDSTYDLGTNSTRFRNVYADTLYGDGANLTNLPASGGSIDLTASGAITANKGVIVNTSGQVEALVGAVAATGSRVNWESGIKYNNTCKLADDKYVVCYRDESSSQAGKCRVVTVSGVTPSFGSEAQFEHNTTNWIKICAIDSSRFAIIFHTNNANEIEVQIGSVSGTSITYGTAVATGFTGNPGDYGTAIGYQSNVNGLLLFGATSGNSDRPYYHTARPSGTTVNLSSTGWVQLESNTGAHDLNVVENTTDNELLLTWICSSNQNGGRSCTLKLAGSSGNHSVTVGQNEFISNQNQYRGRVCYNPDDNVYGYIFRNQDQSNAISQCCGTPSGSGTGRTLSWTTYANVYTSAASTNKPNIAYSAAASRYLLIYGASNNNGRWFVYKQSGTSMVADGSEGTYESSVSTIANPYMNVLDIGNGKFAVTYPGGTSQGYALVRQLASTNLTAENFIGFASASYSNGQTATINTVGNTIGGQSSLTPGQRYYVAGDGTVSQTAGDPEVIAGTAISSTTILIKPQ